MSLQTSESTPGQSSLIDLVIEAVDRGLAAHGFGVKDREGKKAAKSRLMSLGTKCSLCERAAVISCFSCHRVYCGHCYVSYHDVTGQEVQ